jgi:hypothetical protein
VAEGLRAAETAAIAARPELPALPAAPTPPPDQPELTEDGLPRRVRQANLAPQLRRAPGPLPDEPTVPLRSPEQVRSIMSALQLGNTRGRIDASRYRDDDASNGHQSSSEDRFKPEETGNEGSPGSASLDEAATVSFPAIGNIADKDAK